MTTLKVLIVGAGISGHAAAFWLSRLGADITILERHPHLRAYGQQIDIAGQGRVLTRMMGIDDALQAVRCPEPGMRFIDQSGATKAFFPAETKDGEKVVYSPTKEMEVMRGDVVRIMYEKVKGLRGVRHIFGSHVVNFSQDESTPSKKVNVTLSDGSRSEYDVLIGADGIGSSTRRMLLGKDVDVDKQDEKGSPSEYHRDLGVYLSYFTAPALPTDSYDWTVCHMPGGKALMTRRDQPQNIRVYLATRAGFSALDSASSLADTKAELVKLFQGTKGWQMERFLHDLQFAPEADDLYCQRMSQIRLPEGAWSKGRVVLLGDAAYCPGAIGGGVGTTAALIGGYVLAGEIAERWKQSQEKKAPESFSVEEAAKEYERVVRPFVASNSNISTWMVRLWLPETRLGVWGVHAAARFAEGMKGWGKKDKEMGGKEPEKLEYRDYFRSAL